MNKHFEDTKYYLKRAAKTAKAGVAEQIEPIQERVNDLIDRGDEEPEPGRLDELREDIKELQEKAEGETREALEKARAKIDELREERKAS